MNKLIGIAGFARSGKDTLYNRSKIILEKEGHKVCRLAFADELKNESDDFLKKNVGISAFTEDSKEKEIIRPFLVTYGTELRRKLDQNCWIKTIQDKVVAKLDEGYYVFITDVRFKNEAEWVSSNGGQIAYVAREGVKPANHDEHKQLHLYKRFINYDIFWPTFEDNLDKCDEYVYPFLSTFNNSLPKIEQLF